MHRTWHASCESPAFSPAPPPLHPSRSAASQQRLPCTVFRLRLPVLEGPEPFVILFLRRMTYIWSLEMGW